MSTTAVTSTSIYQELQAFYQNRQADVKQLGSALQSGNLQGAQTAFTALTALGQSGPFASSEPFSKSSKDQDFETIGQDLQTGDLAGAQAAFAALNSKQSFSGGPVLAPASFVTVGTQNGGASAVPVDNPSSIYEQLREYQQQRRTDLAQLGQDLQAGNQSAAQQDFATLTALGQSGPHADGQLFQRTDRAQDFAAIGQALQSGDIAGAQSAFASLASTFGQGISGQPVTRTIGPVPIAPPVSQGPPNAPPVTLGPPSAPPSAPPVREPPVTEPPVFSGPPNFGPPNAPPVIQPPSTGTATGGVQEIVINLGSAPSAVAPNGSAAPELTINVPGNRSSASPEEITINFGGGSSGPTVSIGTTEGNSTEQVNINFNQQSNNELVLNLLNSNAASQTQSGSNNALSVQA